MVGRKRKRDPEVTRAAILDAAEALFLNKGFGQTALSEIARSAGVSKSLIHHHFSSKENLWDFVKVRRFAQYAEQQAAILNRGEPSLEVMLDSIRTFFKFLQKHPQVVRLMAWMSIEENTDCVSDMDMGGALVKHGAVLVREGQAKGFIRDDVDPVHMILATFSLAKQWFHDRAHYCAHEMFPQNMSLEQLDELYLESIIKIIERGVSPS